MNRDSLMSSPKDHTGSRGRISGKGPLDSINVDWLTRNDCSSPIPSQSDTTAKSQKLEKDTNATTATTQTAPADSTTPSTATSRAVSPEIQDGLKTTIGHGAASHEHKKAPFRDPNYFDGIECSKVHMQRPNHVVRRSNSLSMNSMGHIEDVKSQKPNFLRSLFGRKKKEEPKKQQARRSSVSAKSDYKNSFRINNHDTPSRSRDKETSPATRDVQESSNGGISPNQPEMPALSRSRTVPTNPIEGDPKLDEFLQRYRSTLKSGASSNARPISANKLTRPDTAKSKTTFSIDEDVESHNDKKPSCVFDAKGRPIPPHPAKSNLAPALRKHYRFARKENLRRTSTNASSSANKFGAFLKRVTSHNEDPSSKGSTTDSDTETSDEETPGNLQNDRGPTIPGLEDLKPLKKVAFATNTYFNDPPQQICSKNPRKGEVEVNSDGSVVIHRLTPEEKREILQKTTSGIVVGGSGHLKLLSDPSVNENDIKRREERKPDVIVSNEDGNEANAKNQSNAALRGAQLNDDKAPREVDTTDSANEEDVSVSKSAAEVKIDKPMFSRRSGCSLSSLVSTSEDDNDDVFPPRDIKIPHDVTYTRCCHLREILPIPATFKQLKKGSTDPIPLLQLRNPKPSMIEVLSFGDFLSIAPVLCLSLDGVSLSVEMLNVILCSLAYKKEFEKLSLRNTPIDHEGWRLLCFFVSKCKSLGALDLSMVPGMSINVQKPSKSAQKSRIVRMECSMDSREELNWDLLTAALATNGGLEEIILSGAKMPLKQFENFIELGCRRTTRLGLAYNSLTTEKCTLLADWLVRSQVTGIDMAYNDLRGKLGSFSATLIEKMQNNNNVFKYISLNSTNLEVPDGAESKNNELIRLISSLCYCDNLKLLDISNNPQIFPHITRHLAHYLPVFVNLMRLQMDYNNIPSMSLVALAEVFPMCQKLNYVSARGTKVDIATGCALAAAMHKSSSLLTLDLDLEGLPDKIKDKISLYGIRNMELAINKVEECNTGPKGSAGLATSKGDVPDNLALLQKELAELLTEKPMSKEDLGVVAQSFVTRLMKARSFIDKMTEDLFRLRVDGNLSTSGKETLIRFCFIDATFERGLRLLAQRYNNKIDIPSHSGGNLANNSHQLPRMESGATLSSDYFAGSGHSALLPFQHPPIESAGSGPAEDAIEIRDDISMSGDSHARDQLKEEGAVLRKSHGIIEHAANGSFNSDDQIDEQFLKNHDVNDVMDLDGGKIKEFILTQDISTVTGFLQTLRRRGVDLSDIFKKRPDQKTPTDASDPATEELDLNSRESSTVVGVQANLLEAHNKQSDVSSGSDSDSDVVDGGDAIDRVYDEVLDNIERGRSPHKTGA
ncbi:LAFA_0F19064g1_1 [Lachancea sp. 'fantastica']|nr:LAFA_0F19064g1_1 [Lachancea sp. 'fantastica']